MGFDYEQFGDRVRALRKERDITQAELASVLNVESHYGYCLKDCVWRRCKDECETLDHKISTICARN